MFARVNEFSGTAEAVEAGLSQAQEISKAVGATPGSQGMYFLVDRDAGKALAITLWDSEQAMRASEESAAQLREESAREAGSQVVGVGHYEVAVNTARLGTNA